MTAIASNPAESGLVFKVSSLFVSNVTASEAQVDIEVYRDSTSYSVIKSGVIPAGKTLSVFASKDMGLYLEEGDSLRLKAAAVDSLEAVCSYSEADPTATCQPLLME